MSSQGEEEGEAQFNARLARSMGVGTQSRGNAMSGMPQILQDDHLQKVLTTQFMWSFAGMLLHSGFHHLCDVMKVAQHSRGGVATFFIIALVMYANWNPKHHEVWLNAIAGFFIADLLSFHFSARF